MCSLASERVGEPGEEANAADSSAAGSPAHNVQVPAESARAVRIELVWSPDGPEATAESSYRGLAWGSAFMYRVEGKDYLVTARHNLTGRHWQTGGCIGEMPVEPTHVRAAFLPKAVATGVPIRLAETNSRIGEMHLLLPIYTFPLIGEDWKPRWLEHPDLRGDMDVAVVPFTDTRGDALITAWSPPAENPANLGVKWPQMSAGDDVFIVGYPLGLVSGPLLPLWMRGTIASEPTMGHEVDGKIRPLMIVDARTRMGSSGSAVMRYRRDGMLVMTTDGMPRLTRGGHSQIIGVYSGRTHKDSDLGFVWRMDEVDPICTDGVPGAI